MRFLIQAGLVVAIGLTPITNLYALDINIDDIARNLERSKGLEIFFTELIAQGGIVTVSDKIIRDEDDYVVRQIELAFPGFKNISNLRLKKRDPKGLTGKLPTVVISAGVQTGMDVIDHIPFRPDTSLVTMDYPLDNGVELKDALKVIGSLWEIQAHYAATYVWLSNQEDVNPLRINSVNVSFGSYIAPFPLRMLKLGKIVPQTTTFAFGGSALIPFIDKPLSKIDDQGVRDILRRAALFMNSLLDPTRHLKDLNGPFLVINSTADKVLPKESVLSLTAGLPKGETQIIEIEGPHIDVHQPEMIQQTVDVVFKWISKQAVGTPFDH